MHTWKALQELFTSARISNLTLAEVQSQNISGRQRKECERERWPTPCMVEGEKRKYQHDFGTTIFWFILILFKIVYFVKITLFVKFFLPRFSLTLVFHWYPHVFLTHSSLN